MDKFFIEIKNTFFFIGLNIKYLINEDELNFQKVFAVREKSCTFANSNLRMTK